MGVYICKQPNGLYCRFSTVVDTITHYNMTEDDYVEMCASRAMEEARDTIRNHLSPFDDLEMLFIPTNMSEEDFHKIIGEMKQPQGVNK